MANAFSDIQKRYGSDNSNTNYSGGSAFADIVDKYGSDDVAPSSSNGGVLEYGKDFLENTGKSISNWYDNSKQALTNYSALQQQGLADGTMTEVPTYGTMDMFEGTPQYVITPGKEQTEEARQIRRAGQDAYNQVVGHPAMYATMTPYMPAPIRAVSGLLTLPTMVDDAVTTYDANSQQAAEEGSGTGSAVLNTAKNLIVDPVLEPAKKWVTDPSGTLDEIREGGLGSAYDNVIMPFEIGKGAAKGAKYVGERVVPDSIQDRVSGPINSVKDTVSGAIDTAKTTGKNMFSDIREKFDSGKTTGAFDDIKETYGDNTPVEYPVENYIEDAASTEGDPTIYNAANPDDMRTAVYQRFKENGFTDTEAAALTGNIEAESGFDVNADSTAFDGNGSRGLVQFTGDRLDGLRRFAEENGSDPNDWKTQVDYATYELTRGNEQGALEAMRENPDATPEEMAVIVRKTYERPAEEYANDAARMDGARKAYNGESSHNNTPRNGASGNTDSMAEIDALNKELDNAYNDSLKSVEDANKGLGDLNPDTDIHGVTIDENGSVKNNLNPYVEDPNATQYQVAWHGIGSKFNEFSNDFVGETNGQAHGYGTYFASDKSVSKQYRDFAKDKTGEGYLKKVDVPEDTEIIKGEYPLTSSDPQVIRSLEQAIDNLDGQYKAKMIEALKEKSGYTPNSYDFEKLVNDQRKAQEDLSKLQDYINTDNPTTGQRIKANSVIRRLGDETPKETLSDKAKLEEYAEQLQQKFSNATKDIEEYKANGGKVDNDITPQMVEEKPSILLNDVIRNSNGFSGEMAYKLLRDVFDSPKMASEYLDKHGIKGMSYTNMSEGRNFVVFNPKNAKILEQDVQYMKAPGKNAVKTDNTGVNYRGTSETGLTDSNNEFIAKKGVNTDFLDSGNRLSDMHTENSPWEYVEGKENLQSDTPVTRKELFKAINDGFTDLRSGHIKESGVRGYFKPQSGVVRVKTYGDFEAAAHELGHLIDRDYNFHSMEDVGPELMKGLRKRFGNSYNNLNMDGIKKEGWAEFFRSYTTNRARAAQDFPKTYRKFTSLLDTNKDLKDKVNKVATAMHKWYSQSPVDRAKGRITFGGEQTSIKEALSSTEPIKNVLNRIYTDVVDNVHPLKQIVDIVEERTGQKLKLEDNPYLQAVLYRGTEGKAQAFLERSGDGHISYADILKDIPEEMHKDLSAYMVAMRDMDILRYNEKALMDNQVVQAKNKALSAKIKQVMDNPNLSANKKQAMIRKLESQKEKLKDTIYTDKSASEIKAVIDHYSKDPKLVKAQKLMVKYNNELLDKLVEGGLLSKEAVSEMRSKYPNYTPFSRDFGDTPNAQVFTGDTSFKNVSAPIKRMKGSARDVVDPLESIIKNTFKVFKEVERNKVAQSFVKLSKQPGMADIVEKLDDVDVKARDNSFFVLENGKKTGYATSPEVFDVLTVLDEKATNMVVKIAQKPAGWLRSGATQLSPEFIFRNPMRDSLEAAIYSKHGFIPYVDTIIGAAHLIKDHISKEGDRLVHEYLNSGAAGSAQVSMDRNYLNETIKKYLKGKRTAKDIISAPYHLIQAFNELTEQATRLGEYRLARKGHTSIINRFTGGKKKVATPYEAALESRDITLDFSRIGQNTRSLNKMIAFFNASVQGTDKIVRMFKEHPGATTLKAVAFITVPTLTLWYLNKDNSAYQELPQWKKDAFWCVPFGDSFLTIPKPLGIGAVFGTVPERFAQWAWEKENNVNGKGLNGLGKDIFSEMAPGVIPTGLLPIVEWASNYSFFRNRNIVPQSKTELPDELQSDQNTSFVANQLGKATGASPMKIDNTIRGYTGGAGSTVLGLIDSATGQAAKRPAKHFSEMPVIKGFMTDKYTSSESVQRVYDKYNEQKEYFNAKKMGVDYENFDPKEYAKLSKAKKGLDKINKAEKAIREGNLDAETKRTKLDNLEKVKTNIARKGLGLGSIGE